jgi:hypothetical protein
MTMPTALCTLADVLARLQLTSDGGDQDAVLEALRLAVEEAVLDLTGYTFKSGSQTEQMINVQLGVSRLTKYRPILPLSTNPTKVIKFEARSLASDLFSTLVGDILDPEKGRVMVVATELTPLYPPNTGTSPWLRWRQQIWPIVRVTYTVDPLGSNTNPIPAALERAAVEWVAAIYSRPAGGAVRSWSTEGVSETYEDLKHAAPSVVTLLLARHIRGQVGIVF